MNNDKINDIIHELSSVGQMFYSYGQLLLNPSINIDRKKFTEICNKCAKHCMEIRQILLENINNKEVK